MASMDFYGFWFNGHHSSEFGIVRVSNGSRYQSNLVPAFQDKTVAVPGGDGTYFFSSNYTNRTFSINFATDSMTEFQYRVFRHHFNGKDTGPLIFDEEPYKVYTAKIQAPPQFNFLCFDEEINGTKQRVYKGEGTIQFICYYPYARSYYKFLDQYVNTEDDPEGTPSWSNINEWKNATTMLDSQGEYDGYNSSAIKLYNAGDIEADSTIWIPIRGDVSLYKLFNRTNGCLFGRRVDSNGKMSGPVEVIPEDSYKSKQVLYLFTDNESFNSDIANAIANEGTSVPISTLPLILYNKEGYTIEDNHLINGKVFQNYAGLAQYNLRYDTQRYSDYPYYGEKVIYIMYKNNRYFIFKPDAEIPEKVNYGELTLTTDTLLTLTSSLDSSIIQFLSFSKPEDISGAAYLSIDSKTNLMNYCDISKTPIRTANDLITAGDFFKLSPGESVLSTNDDSKKIEQVQYDYLFY